MTLIYTDQHFNHDKIARAIVNRLRQSSRPLCNAFLWGYMSTAIDICQPKVDRDGDSYALKSDLRYVDYHNVIKRLRVHGHIIGDPDDGFEAGYYWKNESDEEDSISKYDQDVHDLGHDVIFAEVDEITYY